MQRGEIYLVSFPFGDVPEMKLHLNQEARDWHTPPGHKVSGQRSNAGSSQLSSPIDGALLRSPTIDRWAGEEHSVLQSVLILCTSI